MALQYNRLGKSDLYVSEIAMGGSVPRADSFGSSNFHRSYTDALAAAYDLGINFFDTAESYGDGWSEMLLRRAFGHRRHCVIIGSKVSHEHLQPQEVRKACEKSLQRLGTDYLDIYYVHFPNDAVPLSDTIGTMMDLKAEGKIRSVGLCNFSRSQLEEAIHLGRIDALQQCYSLMWRRYAETELKPVCIEHTVSMVPFSPLAVGLLSGKFTPATEFDASDQRGRPENTGIVIFRKQWFDSCVSSVDQMKPIAAKYGKTVSQLALNWVRSQEGVHSVVSGAKSAAQIEQNVGSAGWEIETEDRRSLELISSAITDRLPAYLHFFSKMIDTNRTVQGSIQRRAP